MARKVVYKSLHGVRQRAKATGGTPRLPSNGPILFGERIDFPPPLQVDGGSTIFGGGAGTPAIEKKALYLIRWRAREHAF